MKHHFNRHVSQPSAQTAEQKPRSHEQPQAQRRFIEKAWVWPLFLFGAMLWSELILRINNSSVFFNTGLIYLVLFDLAITCTIVLLLSFFRPRLRRRFSIAWLSVIFVFFAAQLIYFRFFRTYFTFFSLVRGGQVAEFAMDVFFKILGNLHWLLLFAVPLLIYIFLLRRRIGRVRYTWPRRGVLIVILVVSQILGLVLLRVGGKDRNRAYELYYRTQLPIDSIDRLGLMTTMRLDFGRTFLGWSIEDDLSIGDLDPVPTAPQVTTQTEKTPAVSVLPDATPTPAPRPNTLPIDFDQLLATEQDENITSLHNYFKSLPGTMTNAYTGKFKGYNLIFITAEGYSHYAVNKEITPTLYKMQEEGFKFTNFYNPIWGVSTSDGEYVAMTGMIPKSGVWSFLKSAENWMPFSMGHQFKALGATPMGYHNHTYTYYGRDKSHPNMGYDFKAVGKGLDVRQTWPESDLEMMEKTVDDYIRDPLFHAYYMTVSGHMNYSFTGNYMSAKHRDKVEHLTVSEPARAYMACQIEFDLAMEYLLKRLDEAGVAEKTLIVVSADHYPYGLEKEDIDSLAGQEVESNFELYRSSLLIYAKGMKPEVIDRPVSSLDIIPTVSNLLELPFDSRLLFGTDIFSDTPPLVIFNNRSFISDLGRYNATTRSFTPNPGVEVPENYQVNMSKLISAKFSSSARILETDYYRRVVPKPSG